MKLLAGHDAAVAQWAAMHYAAGLPAYVMALGIVDAAGDLRGAATLHEFNGTNVELCYWGPRTLTRAIAKNIAAVCFMGLGVCRVTCRTPRSNKIVVRHLPKLGFRYEGLLRHFYGPTKQQDAILFGMTREDAARLLRIPTWH